MQEGVGRQQKIRKENQTKERDQMEWSWMGRRNQEGQETKRRPESRENRRTQQWERKW